MNSSSCAETVLRIRVITIIFSQPVLLGSYPLVGPAFDTALEEIAQDYSKLIVTQDVVQSGPQFLTCPEWATEIENALASFYFQNGSKSALNYDVTVFVISGCDEAGSIGRFATAINKLIVSSVAFPENLENKRLWPTWVTTSANAEAIFAAAILKITRMLKWSHLTLICDAGSNSFFCLFAKYLNTFLLVYKYQTYHPAFNSNGSTDNMYVDLLKDSSLVSRVMFYFGPSDTLFRLMTAASQLNMTSGDYVYVAFMAFRNSANGNFTWRYGENLTEENIPVMKHAFRSVIMMEPVRHSSSHQLEAAQLYESRWKSQSADKYNYTYAENEMMSPHPVATYAAMMIMTQVLNELRRSCRHDILNSGKETAKQFRNRTFSLRTGPVQIGPLGERLPTMSMTQADADTDFVSTFIIMNLTTGKPDIVGNISWPGPWPIPDVPDCGFRGDRCSHQDSSDAVYMACAISLAASLIFIISGAAFFCKSYFLVHDAHHESAPWWELSADDVIYVRHHSKVFLWGRTRDMDVS